MSARGHALLTEGRLDKSELAQYSRDGQSSLASDLADCFASSDVANAWTELAAKDLEDVETVNESEFKDVLSSRMKALASQTLRMCGIDPESSDDISIKDQIISWIESTLTSVPTKNVLLKKLDEVVDKVQGGIPGFSVQNGILKVDMVEAFGFTSAPDGQILYHLTGDEQPEEQDNAFRLVEAEVKTKKRKKTDAIEGQLAFELIFDE
ncbi:hypothetical protein KH400_16295 [Desertibacillus haloalkaliphilus]|nr:hypothetical protein [Desertibacillus haloalkaliphilus]